MHVARCSEILETENAGQFILRIVLGFGVRWIKESVAQEAEPQIKAFVEAEDRKSTRLNSSHVRISYAVFCLKKKKKTKKRTKKKKLTIKKKMYEMCNVKLRRRVAEQKSHYIHAFEY